MTSRELVRATLEFKNPPRAPRNMWVLPWANIYHKDEVERIERAFENDFAGPQDCWREYPKTEGDACKIGRYVDEWGCIFTNVQDGVIGEVKDPIIVDEDWEDADNVRFPVEWLTVIPEVVNEQYENSDRWFNCGCCPRPFEQLQYLRGTENLYMDLMVKPPKMMEFIAKMHAFYCELLTVWAQTDVDGLNIMDDWGAQRSLLINPTIWREIFKPMYRDYANIAHQYGKKIFMHSDGNILEIYPDLIEIGIDCLNSQIFCMGVENLAQYAGKICFWGEIDRQHLLAFGTEQEIEDAVELVYKNLWKNGGCIAQLEFGAGAKPQNAYKAFEAWNNMKY
ncbi:MAG: uroporphyrinogen decarboxylase family protein [Oscillospiraceae bacterium]